MAYYDLVVVVEDVVEGVVGGLAEVLVVAGAWVHSVRRVDLDRVPKKSVLVSGWELPRQLPSFQSRLHGECEDLKKDIHYY